MTTSAPETKIVEKKKIACEGQGGALGHPRVWLTIPDDLGWVECPYCDTKYVYGEEIKDAG